MGCFIFSKISLNPPSSQLQLILSDEHSGFIFQPSHAEAVDMLKYHSGGKVAAALRMVTNLGSGVIDAPAAAATTSDPTTNTTNANTDLNQSGCSSSCNKSKTVTIVEGFNSYRRTKYEKDDTNRDLDEGQPEELLLLIPPPPPPKEKKKYLCCFPC
jgi:hypothetical protein